MHVMYTKGYHVYVDDYDDAGRVHTYWIHFKYTTYDITKHTVASLSHHIPSTASSCRQKPCRIYYTT